MPTLFSDSVCPSFSTFVESGHQQQDSFVAQLAEAGEVGGLTVDRRWIDLEIARVDNGSEPGLDGQPDTVDDGMGHSERFDVKRPKIKGMAGRDGDQLDLVVKFELLELVAQQPQRQGSGVNSGAAEFFPQVGDCADMVFVTMGQQQTDDIFLTLLKQIDVRQHQVDTEHIGFGEHQATVDEQDFASVLEAQHVHADLAQATERQQVEVVGAVRHEWLSCPRLAAI